MFSFSLLTRCVSVLFLILFLVQNKEKEEAEKMKEDFYFDYVRLLAENRMISRDGYFLGASNNFVRIFTLAGRRYWLAQATCEHLTADWKIHFSIRPRDIPFAFNLLSELYFNMKMPFGLKARYPDHWKDYGNEWPPHMKGREITVYIYLYEDTKTARRTIFYERENFLRPKHFVEKRLTENREIYRQFDLSPSDEIPIERYLEFADRAETLLDEFGIEPNGCADGDFPLGKFSSLRNEKFIAIENPNKSSSEKIVFIYPPNECGFNGSSDEPNLAEKMQSLEKFRRRKRFSKIFYFSLCFVFVFLLLSIFFFLNV